MKTRPRQSEGLAIILMSKWFWRKMNLRRELKIGVAMHSKIIGFLIILVLSACSHKPTGPQLLDSKMVVKKSAAVDSEPLIRFDYKENEITDLCQQQLKLVKTQLENWKVKYNTITQNSQALLDFEEIMALFSDNTMPLIFMSSVSKSEKLRDEATQCKEKSYQFNNEIFTTREYYKILKEVKVISSNEERLLKETLILFEMNGMSLSEDDLNKYKKLADRFTQLSVQFDQNLNGDTSSVSFSEEELKGVKEDFLKRLKKDDQGRYMVTTKTPDYVHVMENAIQSETRKKMLLAYDNRQATKNTAILQEAIQVRSDMGKLMGFETYADYSLRDKMASNKKVVFDFLNGLKTKLSAKNKAEVAVLAAFKKKELKDASPLVAWDIAYVSNQLKLKKYQLDDSVVKEYFPASHVIKTTMDIYSQVLGVHFKHIKQAPVWAEQVDLFEVSDSETKKVIAYFYADLIPREGKYGHAAAMALIGGRDLKAGGEEYNMPVASIVANFSPASLGKPILLAHREIETFFHEFGHIMHFVLSRAPYASLSGFSVKHDFVEAPSQMLENWVWDNNILKKMSQHYLDPKKQIPNDLMNKMQKLKLFNSGIQNTRQLALGIFDMTIHTNPKVDVTEIYAQIRKDLTGFSPLEGTHFPATFGHMMHGYAAGYYGYLWSKVYAEDMFSEFEKKGILNASLGKKYRKEILEPGNMQDPLILIKNFLGREPNNKAFFKSLGL